MLRWPVAGLFPDDLRGLLFLGQGVWTELSSPSRKTGDGATRLASTELLPPPHARGRKQRPSDGGISESLRRARPPLNSRRSSWVAEGERCNSLVLEGCKRLIALLTTKLLRPELTFTGGVFAAHERMGSGTTTDLHSLLSCPSRVLQRAQACRAVLPSKRHRIDPHAHAVSRGHHDRFAAKSAAKPGATLARRRSRWGKCQAVLNSNPARWRLLEHPGPEVKPSSKRLLGQLPGRR
jgi:hypothetical protein